MGDTLASPRAAGFSGARSWQPINWMNALVGLSAALLIGLQATAMVEIGIWAGGHLLHLSGSVMTVLYIVVGLVGLALTALLVRAAHEAEPFFGATPVETYDPSWDQAEPDV